MNQNLLFLSGLPRSGSTVLGSILNQHPDIHVTPTSPLSDFLCLVDENFLKLDTAYTYDKENIVHNTYSSILSNFYNHIPKKYVIDKHRAWPKNVIPLKKFLKNPKIICTNRRISEVIASYISLIEENNQLDNFLDNYLRKIGKEINLENRVEHLWRNFISDPYESMVFGLQNFSENIHVIDYNDFVNSPEKELDKIYNFLEINPSKHDFDSILNTCGEENDFAWGLDNLHKIRSKLSKTSKPPEEVIGIENTIIYDKFNL